MGTMIRFSRASLVSPISQLQLRPTFLNMKLPETRAKISRAELSQAVYRLWWALGFCAYLAIGYWMGFTEAALRAGIPITLYLVFSVLWIFVIWFSVVVP